MLRNLQFTIYSLQISHMSSCSLFNHRKLLIFCQLKTIIVNCIACDALSSEFFFGFLEVDGRLDDGVWSERDTIDALLDQETGELWIV